MKKTTIALTAISTLLTAFVTKTLVSDKKLPASSVQMGTRIVDALRNGSVDQYLELFPTLADFEEIMKDRASFYGERLPEARDEFARTYFSNLIPQVTDSFEILLEEGRHKGIDWRTIRYVGIETKEPSSQRFGTSPATIVVASGPREYRIKLDRALIINGQWKVSQYIKLK